MYKDEALYLLKGGAQGISEWNRQVAAGKANLDLGGSKLSFERGRSPRDRPQRVQAHDGQVIPDR
jgi:hypothetical protein